MIDYLKFAIVWGTIVYGGTLAHAQDPLQAGGVPTVAEPDYSFLLPFDLGDINGVTDRFGMPIMGPVVKGNAAGSLPAQDLGLPNNEGPAPRRTAVGRSPATSKRTVAKPKEARRPIRSGNPAGVAPQYFVPHGSLEWTPADRTINTSPSSPYGYGHGTSGYGTEVFGDFWKGWPMVQ